MSRLEIKYLAHATGKGAAAAEHLSALEPACKDHIIGLRNIEKLAVHLFCGDIYAAVNTLSNRVIGSSAPQLFAVVISPFKGHAGAEQSLHRLAEMGGVQTYKAHALKHIILYELYIFICDVLLTGVAPPDKHVGIFSSSSLIP